MSCNKDNPSTDPWSFNWTHQNVPHSATSADAYINQAGLALGPNQIVAAITSPSPSYRVSIRLSSLSPNSYSAANERFDVMAADQPEHQQ
ncbi:MAG TPA: hypothetical protein VGQ59_03100 [Cyclobacteriaceae bacterium]|nr:hypothetical protein [Cyclobacteriaceae bacterium]